MIHDIAQNILNIKNKQATHIIRFVIIIFAKMLKIVEVDVGDDDGVGVG